jgi:hypothetical protein
VKQNVVPAGFALTTDWAFWPGLIETPLQGPAYAGPAVLLPGMTTVLVGSGGSGEVGVLVGSAGFDGFVVGVTVGGLLVTVPGGCVVVPGFVGFQVGRDEGRIPAPAAASCSVLRDFPAVAAFFWWETTG